MILQITFSPTGGTKRVGQQLCQNLGTDVHAIELCVPESKLTIPSINADDLVVIAMPVFAGRIPALAAERLKKVSAGGAKCVVVAVYGNRAYDDALLEIKDLATEIGFRVVAAIGAVAEHSIVRKYGAARPDADDKTVLRQYADRILQKIASTNETSPSVPGNRPYKQPMKCPVPNANRKCNACGFCAKNCPSGAISLENPKLVDKNKCISCMKCVDVCPTKSRGIGKIMKFMIELALKKTCAARKENELYL